MDCQDRVVTQVLLVKLGRVVILDTVESQVGQELLDGVAYLAIQVTLVGLDIVALVDKMVYQVRVDIQDIVDSLEPLATVDTQVQVLVVTQDFQE